jgi:ubiquinone/menaquinone biosynthesis C-methylase UbiE
MTTLDSYSKPKPPKPLFELLQSLLTDKKGIEIGGPSYMFKTVLPIYQFIDSLDCANFSSDTIWEGSIQAGQSFNYFENKTGTQFISDGTDLDCIESKTYDFLLSSNCLEHIANPLKALKEWKRVLKDTGFILLVLPVKESNFDHRRAVTSFEHLLEDLINQTTEKDLTHLDEILALHDLALDPPAGNLEQFRLRSLDNFNNRTLHHHVFDFPLIKRMLEYANFEMINMSKSDSDFFAVAVLKI